MKRAFWLIPLSLLLFSCWGKAGETAAGAEGNTAGEFQSPGAADPGAADPGTATPASTVLVLAEGRIVAALPPVDVVFEVAGRLVELLVGDGDEVDEGDTIARVDDVTIREQVIQAELDLRMAELALIDRSNPRANASADEVAVAEASVESARASLRSAEAALTSARTNQAIAERSLDNLAGADEMAEANIESARASLLNAETQLNRLLAGADADTVEQARLNLEQAQIGLANTQLELDVTVLPSTPDYVQKQLEYAVRNSEIAVQLAEIGLRQAQAGATPESISAARAARASASAQLIAAEASLDDIDDQVAQARATVIQAQASVTQAEGSVTQARGNLTSLLAGGSARELASAEINLERAQLALERARRSLEKATLLSPVGGTVVAVHVAPGSAVSPGMPVVTILDTGKLEFHTSNITERDLNQIQSGQTAEIVLRAYPGEPLPGRVARIGTQPGEPLAGSVTFPVVLSLERQDSPVRPGMTGRAEIAVR